MNGPLWHAITAFGGILLFVAILTRLTSDSAPTAKTITSGFTAMTNIYKGAFRG